MTLQNPGMTPLRGEVWWVELGPTIGSEIAKTRPCLILSTNLVNEHRKTVVVLPLSSTSHRKPPHYVAVQCAGRECVAVIDQVRSIAKQRLRERIGALTQDEIERVEKALRRVLEL